MIKYVPQRTRMFYTHLENKNLINIIIMPKELVVKPTTEIATQTSKRDILSLYGVPEMLDRIVKKEKNNLFENLCCGTIVLDSLNKVAHSKDFIVEIPGGFREMLNAGKAAFDKSTKNLGGFTPNIRIKGESGIKGQATIVQKADTQAITQSMSNLAMMAMVQSVLEKLDVIEEKVEEIKMGQKDDRIGCIIGHFKGFMDLYPTFKSSEELNIAATMAYMNMQSGLAKLHLQIENERRKLDGAPSDEWRSLWKSVTHPYRNESGRYQKCYEDYIYDIQLYNRLILLSDVVLYLKGDNEAIKRNHNIMAQYCKDYLDETFKQNMEYLMMNKTQGIDNVLAYNKNLGLALDGILGADIRIECKQSEVKLLNIKEDEENEPKEC
ncbi:MAG: hypothetical protein HXO42_08305 [Prevotella sp.]|mgnify:FL=1|uniref:hypothetical protein n=1 Tax=Prevotella sp. TaxID=59823 RepID=UPI001CB623E7|nr:hypothetical protein [Prevotella sp.]MBF1620471.1 hypothetical protein [Prevotella sp.]